MSKRILKLGTVPAKRQDEIFVKYVCDECGCEFEATENEVSENFDIECPCCHSKIQARAEIESAIERTIEKYGESGFGFGGYWIATTKMINAYYEHMGNTRRISECQIKDTVRLSLKIAYNKALASEDSTGADRCAFFLCRCCILEDSVKFEITFIPITCTYTEQL